MIPDWSGQTWITFVMALPATAIAVATLALAWRGRGRRSVREKEVDHFDRRGVGDAAARAAARIQREQREVAGAAAAIGGDLPRYSGGWEAAARTLSSREEWLDRREAAVRRVYDGNSRLPTASMAHLHLGLMHLWWAGNLLEEWRQAVANESRAAYESRRAEFAETLEAAAGALESAYDAIPREVQTDAGGVAGRRLSRNPQRTAS